MTTPTVTTDPQPTPKPVRPVLETASHRAAGETMLAMGELFLADQHHLPHLKLRLFPLLVGPTGAGKSYLVEQLARPLGANYMKVTRGDWMVQGGKTRCTPYQILDRVTTYDRVILHIDELDKFQLNFSGHEWTASIGSDLWNVLDSNFNNVGEYLRDTQFPGRESPTEYEVNAWVRSRLWIVGSGTWQAVFQANRSGASVGFQGSRESSAVTVDTIAHAGIISPELLHRFNADLVFIGYPNREETVQLLESSGIQDLARELGKTISPDDINWNHGGMRALQTIATKLVVEKHRRSGVKLTVPIGRGMNRARPQPAPVPTPA